MEQLNPTVATIYKEYLVDIKTDLLAKSPLKIHTQHLS